MILGEGGRVDKTLANTKEKVVLSTGSILGSGVLAIGLSRHGVESEFRGFVERDESRVGGQKRC